MTKIELVSLATVALSLGAWGLGCGVEFSATTGAGTTGAGGSSSTSVTGTTSSTSASGGGGAGSTTTTTTTGTGGTGTTTTTTTTTTTGGTGGGGSPPCIPGDLTTCPKGEYCDAGSGTCVSCTAPTGQVFGAPVKLSISAPYPPLALYPRAAPDGQLLFRFRSNQNSDIGVAMAVPGAFLSWSSPTPAPSPLINSPNANEEGPLFLPNGKALIGLVGDAVDTSQPVLLFDSNPGGQRQIYAANPNGQSSSLVTLKSQGTSYQVAVSYAANPPRFWYVSNFFQGPPETQLVTTVGDSDPVKAPIVLDNNCHARGELMAWVTPDGAWMYLSAPYPDPNLGCLPQVGAMSHLFVLPLDASGLPKNGAKAQPIFPNDGNNQVSPSLSENQCVLYFSRVGLMGAELYGAVRQ